MNTLKEILANKDKKQKARDLNFDKERQANYEINGLKEKTDEEL